MEPTTFGSPGGFRRWLEHHHHSETELWVRFHRKATGRPSMTWAEAVDEALCFGWIDSTTRRIDEASWTIRFTPRRRGSVWSRRNVGRVEELTRQGRMRPAGLAAFEVRREERSGIYAYEQRHRVSLPRGYERRFRAERSAWAWFEGKAPSYRQAAIRWVMTAKREETRERRLRQLIEASAAGQTIPPLTPRR
ncbi:MAG TPA: YdeI/OmpD-associated family protein [Actinomycetota bacterium]|nr:YdeI/OmpD-associated family protein [Actinomycetota bacterium]